MKIITTVTILLLALSTMTAQEDWTVKKSSEGITVYTKDTPGSKYMTFKAEMKVKATIDEALALTMDLDVLHTFYDMVSGISELKQISATEAEYNLHFDFPWPAADRIGRVNSKIIPIEVGSVEVISKGIPYPKYTKDNPVLLKKMDGLWRFTNIGNGIILVTHIAFMEPEGNLPAWIVNKSMGEGPIKSLAGFRKLLSKYKGTIVDFLPK